MNTRPAGSDAPRQGNVRNAVRTMVICRLCDASGSTAEFDSAGSLRCPDCGQTSYFRTEPVEVTS